MASIDKRVEDLERAYGTNPREEDSAELVRLREEMKASWPRARERAAREEAEGNPARRAALDEIEARIKERIRRREHGPGLERA
jgi:hypothetical protein